MNNHSNYTIGSCKIEYNPHLQTAFCHSLWINQNYRKSGAGAQLAAFVAKFLASRGCKTISWRVEPFDVADNESKLIKFHESLGGVYNQETGMMAFALDTNQ